MSLQEWRPENAERAARPSPATLASAGLALLLALYGTAQFGFIAGLRIAIAGALFVALNALGDRRRDFRSGAAIVALAPALQAALIVGVMIAPAPAGFGSDLYAPMLVVLPFPLVLLCFVAANLSATDPFRVLFAGSSAVLGMVFVCWVALSDPRTVTAASPIVPHLKTLHALLLFTGAPHYFSRGLAQNVIVLMAAISTILALAAFRTRALARRAAAEEARRGAFASYFSPQLIDAMMRAEGLPPQEKYVVVVDIDLVGFTTLSEKLDPEGAATGLRRYRQIVEDAVFSEGGALAAFVGDGATALFGLAESDPERRALACALRVMGAWSSADDIFDGAKSRLAIGIDAGRATIGLVGEARSLSLLFLGQPVSGAEKLQRATRDAGAAILLSPAAHDALGDAIPGILLEAVETKAGPAWQVAPGPINRDPDHRPAG